MDAETERDRAQEARHGGRAYRILANDPRYRPLDAYARDFATMRRAGVFVTAARARAAIA